MLERSIGSVVFAIVVLYAVSETGSGSGSAHVSWSGSISTPVSGPIWRGVAGSAIVTAARSHSPAGSTVATCTVCARLANRKSVVEGKSVSVRVDLGGRRIIKKKKNTTNKNKQAT